MVEAPRELSIDLNEGIWIMMDQNKPKAPPTPESTNMGGGGKTGPQPDLKDKVISGDRNTGDPADKGSKGGPQK
jgi:hypothetical protein